MKQNFKFEIRRQVAHILLGLGIIILVLFDRNLALWLLLVLVVIGICTSLLHLRFKFKLSSWFLRIFEREEYKKKFPFKGALFFLIGSLLVLKIFSLNIALASIAILTFADSVSHITGKFGTKRHFLDVNKNVEGTIFGIIAGTIAAAFFVSVIHAFLASAAAMIAEVLSLKLQEEEVDDNITIPLIAGTVIFLLQKLI